MPSREHRLQALLDALKAAQKNGAPATAHGLAESLGVSIRTLYRDVDRLRALGVPVSGRTGVGFALDRSARVPDSLPSPRARGSVEARVRVSPAGAKMLGEDPLVDVERGRGTERVVRAATREAIVRAALRASGEVVVLGPDKLRREIRTRARAVARAHKG